MIVPLFALANAGHRASTAASSRARSPRRSRSGSCVGYVVGKPLGHRSASSWLVTRLSRGRLRPPVGWAAVAGGGTIAGIGFTVSLLIAALAFHGRRAREAKLGVLAAAALARRCSTWLVFRGHRAAARARARSAPLLGAAEPLVDLADPGRPPSATTSAARPTRR